MAFVTVKHPPYRRSIPPLSPEDIGRFWSKMRRGDPAECWPWLAGRFSEGYGSFKIGPKDYPAHCVAYTLLNGAIPDDCGGLHECDRPDCVNPFHIWAGTDRDNQRDAAEKGRRRNHVLKAADVAELKATYAAGETSHRELAAVYGVSRSTVSNILSGKTRNHVR